MADCQFNRHSQPFQHRGQKCKEAPKNSSCPQVFLKNKDFSQRFWPFVHVQMTFYVIENWPFWKTPSRVEIFMNSIFSVYVWMDRNRDFWQKMKQTNVFRYWTISVCTLTGWMLYCSMLHKERVELLNTWQPLIMDMGLMCSYKLHCQKYSLTCLDSHMNLSVIPFLIHRV